MVQSSPVSAMCWPVNQPNFLVFGLADGKVRAGNLKSNKSQTLYNSNAYTVSMAASPDGNSFVSGHEDGAIYRFSFDEANGVQGLLVKHSVPAYALAWGEQILAAGPDKRVTIYDLQGRVAQKFDYSRADGERESTVAIASPSGQSIAIGRLERERERDRERERRERERRERKEKREDAEEMKYEINHIVLMLICRFLFIFLSSFFFVSFSFFFSFFLFFFLFFFSFPFIII